MSNVLTTRSCRSPARRLFGSPALWMRDCAIVGGVTAYAGAAFGLFGLSLHPWLVLCGLSGALTGAGLGLVGPILMNWLRYRAPLPVIAVGLPLFVGSVALAVATVAATTIGAPLMPALYFAGVAAFVQTAVFWLPYTMATVLDQHRWPVVAVACLVAPLTGPLAILVATML